jgi:transposase InsO family protein
MIVMLQTQGLKTLDDVRGFLAGSQGVEINAPSREAAYTFIAQTLRRFGYRRLPKADKGVLKRYLGKVTGLSRAQVTRLIAQHQASGQLRDHRGVPARPFSRRYTADDVRLLAEVDALHGNLSGPATRKLCERAWQLFDDARYEHLAGISNGHLYNLRGSRTDQRCRGRVNNKTRAVQVRIGERRRPRPEGRPGFLRVDSVHQGDLDGIKGLYHINLVDEVTQFQFVGSVERISEHFLLPVLESLLDAFPFIILGFHSDNGSEYINRQVASLLEKLRVEQFTKSRSRRTNDNALVESKNGSVVRKHLGYSHIPSHFAQQVNTFAQQVLSPYLNFHRPCFFPTEEVDAKGRLRKRYRYETMTTPYEKLKSLPDAPQYLKPEISFDQLDAIAYAISDNETARCLNEARTALFDSINQAQQPAA